MKVVGVVHVRRVVVTACEWVVAELLQRARGGRARTRGERVDVSVFRTVVAGGAAGVAELHPIVGSVALEFRGPPERRDGTLGMPERHVERADPPIRRGQVATSVSGALVHLQRGFVLAD